MNYRKLAENLQAVFEEAGINREEAAMRAETITSQIYREDFMESLDIKSSANVFNKIFQNHFNPHP